MGRSADVLEALPHLQSCLQKLHLRTTLVQSKLIEGSALRTLGRVEESILLFENALGEEIVKKRPCLRVFLWEFLGDSFSLLGSFERATACFAKSMDILRTRESPCAVAWLKLAIGEHCRLREDLPGALASYSEAVSDYSDLRLRTWQAYAMLLRAEVLLAMRRDEEAATEILHALPLIDASEMVPEGFAAIAILRESIRRRKTDRNALRELKDYLARNH
jgi:tetratricopeptide (TPR) repeat protein